jgi:predicted PurR-regulated permease PerM
MRPGVEALHRHRVPRALGVALHYLAVACVFGLFVWLVVPRALTQIEAAVGNVPHTRAGLHQAAQHSSGIKHQILTGIESRLRHLPTASELVHPALSLGKTALKVLVSVFFTLACAAYWIFEKERMQDLVLSLVPRAKRKVVRGTWDLIDLKLGAFVRGQMIMVTFVATVLSIAFWRIGLPYFLLLGAFAGLVEMVPVVGPLLAAVLAIGVGLTVSVKAAIGAAIAVWGLRLIQDYVVGPRVLGHAVGLSPLIVLVTVSVVGILLGGFYVLLSVPIAAVLATLVDVLVFNKDPADEAVPTVLFPAKDAEA